MSASSTPTDRPRTAIAAARLTVTLDFPTPPLPDATAYTRVSEFGWAKGMTGSRASPRNCLRSSVRCSSFITSRLTPHGTSAGDVSDRLADALADLGLLRATGGGGQVNRYVHATAALDVNTLTIPSSVIGAPQFGVDHLAQGGTNSHPVQVEWGGKRHGDGTSPPSVGGSGFRAAGASRRPPTVCQAGGTDGGWFGTAGPPRDTRWPAGFFGGPMRRSAPRRRGWTVVRPEPASRWTSRRSAGSWRPGGSTGGAPAGMPAPAGPAVHRRGRWRLPYWRGGHGLGRLRVRPSWEGTRPRPGLCEPMQMSVQPGASVSGAGPLASSGRRHPREQRGWVLTS